MLLPYPPYSIMKIYYTQDIKQITIHYNYIYYYSRICELAVNNG